MAFALRRGGAAARWAPLAATAGAGVAGSSARPDPWAAAWYPPKLVSEKGYSSH